MKNKVLWTAWVGLAAAWFGGVAPSIEAQPAGEEKAAAVLPLGDMRNARCIRCVVRKDADRDFAIMIRGQIGEGGAPLKVKRPDGTVVLEAALPAGTHEAHTVKVPKDGRTGEYVILIATRDGKDSFSGPLTDLPKEVYVMSYWIQSAPARFFTRARGDQPESVTLTPHKSRGKIETPDGKALAETSKGEALTAPVGAEGVWISSPARYVDAASSLVLALTPEAWFAPGEAAATMKP